MDNSLKHLAVVIDGIGRTTAGDALSLPEAGAEAYTEAMRCLVYANAGFAEGVTGAYVDRDARKPGVKGTPAPSDHAPVIVDLG